MVTFSTGANRTATVTVTVAIPGGVCTGSDCGGNNYDQIIEFIIIAGCLLVLPFGMTIAIDTRIGKGKMSGTTTLAIFLAFVNVMVIVMTYTTLLPSYAWVPVIIIDVLVGLAIAGSRGGNI
jgi:hypothetical protein